VIKFDSFVPVDLWNPDRQSNADSVDGPADRSSRVSPSNINDP
jgi:hypothetical protein